MSQGDGDRVIHQYDDIQEADNQLPRWWLGILWGTVAFAALYWIWFHVLGVGATPLEAYRQDRMAVAQAEAARLKAEGPMTPERLVAMSQNAAIVLSGRSLFTATCASCHGPKAAGLVGPNLTDDYWLHGGKPEQILTTVRNGWVDKGMPAWGPQLGEDRVREVVAYVISIRNTNLPGKPPQGQKEP
jgi:cytochrome c oxidase cbb3-type subunit III